MNTFCSPAPCSSSISGPRASTPCWTARRHNFRFKEFPEAAQYVIDTNHWFDPRNPTAIALKKEVEGKGKFFTYNVRMNYSAVLLLADAIERAGSLDRAKIIAALETSTFAGHIMPYGPTKFVHGQNQGAAPGEYAGAGRGHQSDLPRDIRRRQGDFPDPHVDMSTSSLRAKRSNPDRLHPLLPQARKG